MFKNRRYGVKLQIREVWIAVEYRNGSIFRTRSIGHVAGSAHYFAKLAERNPNIVTSSPHPRVYKLVQL